MNIVNELKDEKSVLVTQNKELKEKIAKLENDLLQKEKENQTT